MSILNSQAVKFQILSDVASEKDVFDNLIYVKHCLTGEKGYLLCSHYSRWPVDLINKADWLAGCFTPELYFHNDKLVFGNIPDQIINWEIDEVEKTVVLSILGKISDRSTLGVRLIPVNLQHQINFQKYFRDEVNLSAADRVKEQINLIKATKRLLFGNTNVTNKFLIVRDITNYLKRRDTTHRREIKHIWSASSISYVLGFVTENESQADYEASLELLAQELGFTIRFSH